MRRSLAVGVALLAVAASPLMAGPARAHVNVNIGAPPAPAIVVPAPPRLVIVPSTPVFYAPEVGYNYFVYENQHYIFRDGRWFAARTYRGPWRLVAVNRIPRPLAAVPVAYYKVPPGHAKKFVRGEWRERGPDRDRGHGHGKGKHGD